MFKISSNIASKIKNVVVLSTQRASPSLLFAKTSLTDGIQLHFASYKSEKLEERQSNETAIAFERQAKEQLLQENPHNALDLYKKVLEIQMMNYGENHPGNAPLLHKIASLYQETERPGRSIEYFQKASEIYETNKDEAENYIICLQSVAQSFGSMGHISSGLDWNRRALNFAIQEFGASHRLTGLSYLRLGKNYLDLEDTKTAFSHVRKAQKILRKALLPNHELQAQTSDVLAEIYFKTGKLEKSVELYQQSLKIYRLVYGAYHPKFAACLNSLGAVQKALSQTKNAFDSYSQSLQIYKNTLGEKHSATINVLSNLASFNTSQNGLSQRISQQATCLESYQGTLGNSDPKVLSAVKDLIELYKQAEQFDKAAESLYFYYEGLVMSSGQGSEESMAAMNELATCLEKAGDHHQAVEVLENVLEFFQAQGLELQLQQKCCDRLSVMYEKMNQGALSAKYSEKTIQLIKLQNNKNQKLVDELVRLGGIYSGFGNYKECLKTYLEANQVQESINPTSSLIITISESIGDVYTVLGQKSQASASYLRAQAAHNSNKKPFDYSYDAIYERLQKKIKNNQ